MPRLRPQLTLGQVIEFLGKYSDTLPVYCSTSVVNLDEPVETQEFILWDERSRCVAVECDGKSITFGFAREASHVRDEDCKGFVDASGCCSICGAGHGDPCEECSGSAYHRDGCTQSDAYHE